MKTHLAKIYSDRFDIKQDERETLWKTLVKNYFQKFISPDDVVLDLAAGYCEFINNVTCKKKIAVDLNKTTNKKATRDVKVYNTLSTRLPKELSNSVDVVFTSNFFEHLDSKDELLDTLAELRRVLKKDGKLMVLQPNIRLVGNRYWDYIDHTLPLTEKSLSEALELSGFKLTLQKTRFLPYTANSKLPINAFLIRLYLLLPFAQFLFGKQTFIIAKSDS